MDWLQSSLSSLAPFIQLKKIDTFHFDIVQGCQLRCIGCPNSTVRPVIEHISPDDFHRCLANVDVSHVETLRLFNFGEAFLHPKIIELLAVLGKQKWQADRVEISTNAMIYDEKLIREILRAKLVTHLIVSCDGDGTPEEFERLRPPASWGKLLEFLKGVSMIKQELVSSIHLMTRTVCGTEEGHMRWRALLTPLGWEPEFRDWILLPNSSHRPWDRVADATHDKRICWPLQGVKLFVNCHGDVIPCCAYPDMASFGNLKNEKFSSIFRNASRRQMIKTVQNGRASQRICSQCEQ